MRPIGGKGVIYGQLLATADSATADVPQMASHAPRHEIRVAGMVDELRPASANRAINDPAVVKPGQVNSFGSSTRPNPFESARSLPVSQFLACVFDYPFTTRYGFLGKNAFAMNG
jgi:hypothetical protein